MQSHYEINVSKNGKHVFATASRSLTLEYQARKLYLSMKDKFQESDGYEVSITYWECRGTKKDYHKGIAETLERKTQQKNKEVSEWWKGYNIGHKDAEAGLPNASEKLKTSHTDES